MLYMKGWTQYITKKEKQANRILIMQLND